MWKDRQRRPEYVVVGQRIAVTPERNRVAHDGLMRNQRAFRVGRRAGGIEHDRRVAQLHAQTRFVDARIRAEPRQRHEFGRWQEPGRRAIAQQDQAAQLRRHLELQATRIHLALETRQRLRQPFDEIHVIGDLARRDDGDQIAVRNRVGEFAVLVARVERHGHRAAQRDREQELDELGTGRQQQADVVTWLHAQRLQRPRARKSPVGEFAIREPLIRQDQRGRIGVAIGRDQQQITQRGDLDADLGQILAVQMSVIAQGSASRKRIEILALPGAIEAGCDARRELGEFLRSHVQVFCGFIRERLDHRVTVRFAQPEKIRTTGCRAHWPARRPRAHGTRRCSRPRGTA
jgi:hypothetical protein